MSGATKARENLWLIAAVLLPAVVTNAILIRHNISYPYADDFDALLNFANRYVQLHGAAARLHLMLTWQFMEYKYTFDYVVLATMLGVWHRIDFYWLNLFGNSFFLLIFYALWRICFPAEPLRTRLLLFLPVSLILWSPCYFDATDLALTSLQAPTSVAFGLLAIDQICGAASWRRVLAASGFALLAFTCSPNAAFLWPLGLFAQAGLWRARGGWPKLAVWTASFALGGVPYVYHYVHMLQTPPGTFPRMLVYFFSFLGSERAPLGQAVPLGATLAGLPAYAVWRRFDRVNLRVFLMALWMLMTAGLIGYTRSGDWLKSATVSRYAIHSTVMLVFGYVFLAERLRAVPMRRGLYGLALAASLLLAWRTDRAADIILAARNQGIAADMRVYRTGLYPQYGSEHGYRTLPRNWATLDESVARGVFVMPADGR